MTDVNLDTFTEAYIECALWSSNDESTPQGGRPLDENYTLDDIAPETLAKMVADCQNFLGEWYEHVESDLSRAGRDFWLSRNGHGAGFFDGDWDQPYEHRGDGPSPYETLGDYLQDVAEAYGEFNLYIGDDGLIYGQ